MIYSWYSWTLNSMVNGVYAFGFLFMLPQLFVNYKLKSVAALPWRAFMYKAFNTFIDDIFAFIITMPTAHRIACFRDDIVFLIYLVSINGTVHIYFNGIIKLICDLFICSINDGYIRLIKTVLMMELASLLNLISNRRAQKMIQIRRKINKQNNSLAQNALHCSMDRIQWNL